MNRNHDGADESALYRQAVEAARGGDEEAFRFLYERTWRDKWYIAQKYMRNEEDAQDVLQDAYLKAWKSLSSLNEPEKFPGWLSLIVANTALNALKKKKDLPFSALETETEEGDVFSFEQEDFRTEYRPEHAYTDKETSELLGEMLDALSDEQRFCMLMYYVEERSVSEIAETIGCAKGTVTSRLNYGRKNLKAKAKELEKRGYTLYGLSALPLFRTLLRTEKAAQVSRAAGPVFDTAMAAGPEPVPSTSSGTGSGSAWTGEGTAAAATAASASAGATGAALGTKIAIGLLSLTLVGGGGYAAVKSLSGEGGSAVSASTVSGEEEEPDSDDGYGMPGTGGARDVFMDENPLWGQLPSDVQERFLTQIAYAEEDPENRSYAWIYFDDDPFPDLLVRSETTFEGIELAHIYYGTTGETLFDPGYGEEKTILDKDTGDYVIYFVPGEGVLIEDEIYSDTRFDMGNMVIELERALVTFGVVMTGPGNVETRFMLIRNILADGKEAYYYAPVGGTQESDDCVEVSREEYGQLHYDGSKIPVFP